MYWYISTVGEFSIPLPWSEPMKKKGISSTITILKKFTHNSELTRNKYLNKKSVISGVCRKLPKMSSTPSTPNEQDDDRNTIAPPIIQCSPEYATINNPSDNAPLQSMHESPKLDSVHHNDIQKRSYEYMIEVRQTCPKTKPTNFLTCKDINILLMYILQEDKLIKKQTTLKIKSLSPQNMQQLLVNDEDYSNFCYGLRKYPHGSLRYLLEMHSSLKFHKLKSNIFAQLEEEQIFIYQMTLKCNFF